MFPIIVTVLSAICLVISIFVVLNKRKSMGITGFKSVLSSICLSLVAIINILAYWFSFLGIFSWLITFLLILLGGYFTKYLLPMENK